MVGDHRGFEAGVEHELAQRGFERAGFWDSFLAMLPNFLGAVQGVSLNKAEFVETQRVRILAAVKVRAKESRPARSAAEPGWDIRMKDLPVEIRMRENVRFINQPNVVQASGSMPLTYRSRSTRYHNRSISSRAISTQRCSRRGSP